MVRMRLECIESTNRSSSRSDSLLDRWLDQCNQYHHTAPMLWSLAVVEQTPKCQ
jgi:hypothetical protein